MRGPALERKIVAIEGQGAVVRERVPPESVEHQGQVDTVEDPLVGHGALGPVLLFGRSADDPDFPSRFLDNLSKSQPCVKGHRPVGVMPAGMPDLGEGVILG